LHLGVLPEHKGQGIGKYLTQNVITVTSEAYSAVRLVVEQGNAAKVIYERLGFISNHPVYNMTLPISTSTDKRK